VLSGKAPRLVLSGGWERGVEEFVDKFERCVVVCEWEKVAYDRNAALARKKIAVTM